MGVWSNAGALANLGHCVCDQTVGNILDRHGIGPRRSAARRFVGRISAHVRHGDMDFFTVVLFLIQFEAAAKARWRTLVAY